MALRTAPFMQPSSKRVPPACDGYLITHRPCRHLFSWAFGPDSSTRRQQKISPLSLRQKVMKKNGAQNLRCQHDCEQIKKAIYHEHQRSHFGHLITLM